MVEQWTENPCVPGSILGPATMNNIASYCGSSSGVEHNLAKVGVAGSNPVFRSRFYRYEYNRSEVVKGFRVFVNAPDARGLLLAISRL